MNINDMLAFVTDVKERQSILVVSNENDADSIHDGVTNLKNDLLIDYRTKSIRNYSKFTTDGGMLFTTMRAISEGNNVNHAQTMIIVAPEKTVTNTIK